MPETALSTLELTRLRDAVDTISLIGTALVLRPSEGQDSDGNVVTTYATAGTLDVGLFKRVRRIEIDIRAMREAEENFYSCILPWNADVNPDDRLSIGGVNYAINILWKGHSMSVGTRARITRID